MALLAALAEAHLDITTTAQLLAGTAQAPEPLGRAIAAANKAMHIIPEAEAEPGGLA